MRSPIGIGLLVSGKRCSPISSRETCVWSCFRDALSSWAWLQYNTCSYCVWFELMYLTNYLILFYFADMAQFIDIEGRVKNAKSHLSVIHFKERPDFVGEFEHKVYVACFSLLLRCWNSIFLGSMTSQLSGWSTMHFFFHVLVFWGVKLFHFSIVHHYNLKHKKNHTIYIEAQKLVLWTKFEWQYIF